MATKTKQRKHARDYAPFKSVSAYIVLRSDGTEVAKVHAYHGNGQCVVTVYNYGEDNPNAYRGEDGPSGCVTSSAGGWGYDRFTSALSGIHIDGLRMANHCEESLVKSERFPWTKNSIVTPGYSFANWDSKKQQWGDCYKLAGLKYLEALGYRIIQAV